MSSHGGQAKRPRVRASEAARLEALRTRAETAEETLRAIRGGEVDAIVVGDSAKQRVFMLSGADRPYRTFYETTRDGAAMVAGDGTILSCNTAFAGMAGAPPERLVGASLPDLFSATDAPAVRAALGVKAAALEASLGRSDGSSLPVSLRLDATGEGDPPVVAALVRDLTEHHRAQELRSRLASIVEHSGDGIVGTTLDGIVTEWNRGAEAVYGYAAAEIIGQSVSRLIPPEDRGELALLRERFARGERVERREATHVRKDGREIRVWLSFSPILDAGGRIVGIGTISRDVTEQKRTADELRALTETLDQRVRDRTAELEAANRELDAFAYSVSHDLRAPLRAIDGFSDLLLRNHAAALSPEGAHYLARVREASRKMAELIEHLLQFSRLGRQALQREHLDAAAVARAALDELAAEFDERRSEVAIGELPPCEADPILLRLVFRNLIANALKFTRGREPARIEVGWQNGDPGTRGYFVRDNGAGFDMRYADKLFGLFQRLHREEDYPGTGVGLAIVQRIVSRHGGRVWAEGEVDRGATFHFTIGESSR